MITMRADVRFRLYAMRRHGMGRGDEDRDYFEFTTIYLNGDVILQS